MKQEVEFFSRDGMKIAGNLYSPARNIKGSRLPAIVLCQGLSGIKEKVLPAVAEAFAFDIYIGVGPRQVFNMTSILSKIALFFWLKPVFLTSKTAV